ncbi:hypothetical protein KXW72_003956 [Aspergillus fumigatus]|nr:hypothetical protein KXW72_003956 [Aspergillus fumigatus]
MIVRANVPGSGSGWRGAHSVWGGPCVGPRAHTKWAGGMRVHMHIYIWMDGWVSAYPHGWMPPAGHAGIRRGRRPCACRCKCPRRRRAALRCRQGRARAGQLVTSGASRVRLGVSRPGVGPWRAPANWSPPVPASVSLGQRLSMARALACRRPACPRGSRQLVTLPPARAAPPAAPTRPANWPPRARLRASPSSSSSPSSPSSPSLRRPRARDSLLASGRPTCAGRPRAARAAMCPSQLVTALRHQAAAARGSPRPSRPANWRESMEVEIPRGPAVTGAPPRLRRKVSGPPSKRPALPGPLMGGVCQQI